MAQNSSILTDAMDLDHRISFTDLSSKTRQLLESVREGEPVFLEEGGEDEAVVVDITDYRLLRATMHAVARMSHVAPNVGLTEEALPPAHDVQARYNQIVLHYLSGSISLSRAAELLDSSPMDLRRRFERLGLPQRSAPSSVEEAQKDSKTALDWAETDDS